MVNQITLAYLTALFLVLLGYVLGYTIGRLDIIYNTLRLMKRGLWGDGATREIPEQASPAVKRPRNDWSFTPAQTTPAKKIDINDTTFVAPVSTAGMERAGTGELGKTTAVQDDIQSSVAKLSNLKGK